MGKKRLVKFFCFNYTYYLFIFENIKTKIHKRRTVFITPKTDPIILFSNPRAIIFKSFVKILAIILNSIIVIKKITVAERMDIKFASDSKIGFSFKSKYG